MVAMVTVVVLSVFSELCVSLYHNITLLSKSILGPSFLSSNHSYTVLQLISSTEKKGWIKISDRRLETTGLFAANAASGMSWWSSGEWSMQSGTERVSESFWLDVGNNRIVKLWFSQQILRQTHSLLCKLFACLFLKEKKSPPKDELTFSGQNKWLIHSENTAHSESFCFHDGESRWWNESRQKRRYWVINTSQIHGFIKANGDNDMRKTSAKQEEG